MVPLVALVLFSPSVELRPTRSRVDAPLRPIADDERKAKALFIGGRDSGLRVPAEAEITIDADHNGEVAGTIETTFSGAITRFYARAFYRSGNGGGRVLPLPKGFDQTVARDVDHVGRTLVIASSDDEIHSIDNPFYAVQHAFLWQSGHLTDLGAADEVHFVPGGGIVGQYSVDARGWAINRKTQATRVFPAAFSWRNGRRAQLLPNPRRGSSARSDPTQRNTKSSRKF